MSKTRVAVELNCSVILLNYTKPRDSTPSQTIWMAAHMLDWGDSLNQRRRGGERHPMVMMFVGGVVLVLDGIPVLFVL